MNYFGGHFVGFVQQNLRHSLDGDGERNDRVIVGITAAIIITVGIIRRWCSVRDAGAEGAENGVARLAKEQFLRRMDPALGDDLPALAGHQIQQLVH